nr:MAG TPA: hypothetical protein [Caudoviricetes sp.]DAS08160.1 MAG TPA: hypothetical protein [Caudoviricetes sp.]
MKYRLKQRGLSQYVLYDFKHILSIYCVKNICFIS